MWQWRLSGWLEEGPVGSPGPRSGWPYSALPERGAGSLPVVALAMDYRQPLRHGGCRGGCAAWGGIAPAATSDLERRFSWRGELAAEARVDLVVLDLWP